jgi:hypothetical protein
MTVAPSSASFGAGLRWPLGVTRQKNIVSAIIIPDGISIAMRELLIEPLGRAAREV